MDDLVAVYRAGLVALYADGTSYGAAQFGETHKDKGLGQGLGQQKPRNNTSMTQPSTTTTAANANITTTATAAAVRLAGGGGGGWIEREIAAIKHSYEEEMKLLESETNELRGKLRQSDKYISELRRR